MLGVSLWADLYMTREDQIFVAYVVVSNSMHETMVLSVISWLVGAGVEFSAIFKIRKYKGLHEGHHVKNSYTLSTWRYAFTKPTWEWNYHLVVV
jgi:hypothetical protein